MPASLEPVNAERTVARVVIRQGMYHQIKRMFARFGLTVLELHREKMGGLSLDPALDIGECRYIENEELTSVFHD